MTKIWVFLVFMRSLTIGEACLLLEPGWRGAVAGLLLILVPPLTDAIDQTWEKR